MKRSETAEKLLNERLQDTSSGGIASTIMDLVEQDRLSRTFVILSFKCLLNVSASSDGKTCDGSGQMDFTLKNPSIIRNSPCITIRFSILLL